MSDSGSSGGVRLIPLSEVMHKTGRKKTFIYEGVKEGWFPKPIQGRPNLWVESEIDAYNLALVRARDMGQNVGTDRPMMVQLVKNQ